MGDAGGFLRHSIGGLGASSQPSGAGGGGLWGARSLFTMGPRNRCRKRLSRVELLPEPGSESRFRIPPEPGAAAWWERSPGSLTIRVVHSFCVLDPGISAPEFQPLNFTPGRAGALIPVA